MHSKTNELLLAIQAKASEIQHEAISFLTSPEACEYLPPWELEKIDAELTASVSRMRDICETYGGAGTDPGLRSDPDGAEVLSERRS